ncbi:MAG: hypothetical protein KDE05_06770 [Parvularculaceae bacterium]|nr:hypothetical protein [Parvularculaceae bacterium]
MIEFAAALFLGASKAEIPAEKWNCRNQVEVWCAADGCAATPPDESTPMDIWASAGEAGTGTISACAYTGCWEGAAATSAAVGRLLWIGDDLPFKSVIEGATSDVTLLILAEDGVGFIRVGGIATPLLCARRLPYDGEE